MRCIAFSVNSAAYEGEQQQRATDPSRKSKHQMKAMLEEAGLPWCKV